MRVDVFTIFPEPLAAWLRGGVVGRAIASGVLDVRAHDLRDGATDERRSVDDSPFGGGAGMVLRPDPVFAVVEAVQPARPLFLLSPSGRRFDQAMAEDLAGLEGFSLLCGRYEGVDQRIADHLVDGEISIGDFVLAGGEVAAMAIVETVGRLVPGVLGNARSADEESFSDGLLEYEHYTRPAEFRGWSVPEVLVSGHHAKVAQWRHASALHRTLERRPDLIERRGGLSEDEVGLLERYGYPVSTWDSQLPARADAPIEEHKKS